MSLPVSGVSSPLSYFADAPRPGRTPTSSQLLDNDAGFANKVEKHLDDVARGRPYLSKDTSQALLSKNRDNARFLSGNNPSALRTYSGMMSGLSYNQSSRFIAAVERSNKTTGHLNALARVDQEKMAKALIEQFERVQVSANEERLTEQVA